MTMEEFLLAEGLIKEITALKRNREGIEHLLSRVKELSKERFALEIKIDEEWCYTPDSKIYAERFVGFLEKEIKFINHDISRLENDFAGIHSEDK